MADIETLGLLEEIQTLVSDKLQVVSYKWLSRNFLVSSNAAKRLLQEFVDKHGSSSEVVYTLAGWLKKNPSVYNIRLVSCSKLAEAKQEFDEKCSIQVYSVQACIPKDPAAIWNAEFVQAEELFKQPSKVDNCLRDNRFCAISSSFVKRNVEGAIVSVTSPQAKSVGAPGPSKTIPVQPQPHSSPKIVQQHPSKVSTDVKTQSNGLGVHDQANKPNVVKEKVPPVNKKKGQNDKSTSGTGSSLANLWGRVPAKSKPSAPVETDIPVPNPTVSAEAQICAREAVECASSDEDEQGVNFKRGSNGEGSRKRRVVMDFSDEEDDYPDAVNLASPDPPKAKSTLDSGRSTKTLSLENKNLDFEKEREEKPIVKEEREEKPKIKEKKATGREPKEAFREDLAIVSRCKNTKSSPEKSKDDIADKDVKKDQVTSAALSSPKRRKVLKTRIDERGREVTEVVWEGEETETKKPESNTTKKTDDTVTNVVNRPPAAKKTPVFGSDAASNAATKAGNKKGGNAKDPKQGNIMSFFKRA